MEMVLKRVLFITSCVSRFYPRAYVGQGTKDRIIQYGGKVFLNS